MREDMIGRGQQFILVLAMVSPATQGDVIETMDGKSVDEFSTLLRESAEAKLFTHGEVTIFAPSDGAMTRYRDGKKDTQFILNHMVNYIVNIDKTTVSADDSTSVAVVHSLASGAPPLFLTRRGPDYYVNGAKLIMRNLRAQSPNTGRGQRLHIVDRVLELLREDTTPGIGGPGVSPPSFVGLTAGRLLRYAGAFDLGRDKTISRFAAQVRKTNRLSLFNQPGQNTFFVPIDSAFRSLDVNLVDRTVIAGHVVPDHLLFTRPQTAEHKTATFSDGGVSGGDGENGKNGGIRVTVVMQNKGAQVKSVLARGSANAPRGTFVVANVVRANIPVSNGLVHLIDRPLVVIAAPIWDYLNADDNRAQVGKLADHLSRLGGDLEMIIRGAQIGTLFAPSNRAFTSVVESILLRDQEAAKRILGLHFVDQRIAGDDVRIHQPQNGLAMYDAPVSFPPGSSSRLWLYFRQDNETLMVDGLGAAAEVVQADVGATNGVIHIIDRVLGIPAQSVYDKLADDPMLSSAFSLGNQDHFNDALTSSSAHMTYLVPSNQAWDGIRQNFASAHKQLFMGVFGYQSRSLLERHFLKGESLSAEELVQRTLKDGGVQMLRGMGPLRFGMELNDDGQNDTVVYWEDLKAKLVRPNLNCTNGYVHILDKVLMKRRDMTVSTSLGTPLTSPPLPRLLSLSMLIAVQVLGSNK